MCQGDFKRHADERQRMKKPTLSDIPSWGESKIGSPRRQNGCRGAGTRLYSSEALLDVPYGLARRTGLES